MRNYAVPDHDARPSADDIDALITFPRVPLEKLKACCPGNLRIAYYDQ
jgi:hypothetical protein